MRILVASLAFTLTAIRAVAQGGPPMITDDASTVPNGHWEINLAVTAEHRPGLRAYETPLIDANYGYGDRTQFKWEVPWVTLDRGHEGVVGGIGNSNVGVRYRFMNANGHRPAVST